MSFWTVCPYCWILYQYEKIYEECSLRCQNCRRAFHGAPVDPPVPEIIVSGKDQYYCYHAYLPVRYPAEKGPQTKRRKERAKRNNTMHGGQSSGFQVEEARFEGLHGGLGKDVGEGVQVDAQDKERERVVQRSGNTALQSNGKRQMKKKTVARSTKKISGNKFRFGGLKPRLWQEELLDSDEEHHSELKRDEAKTGNGCEHGVLDFSERDGEIFVGDKMNE